MPTRELYVQGTKEPQLLEIQTPHRTTEDYRSRYWVDYVSYQLFCSAIRQGTFPRGGFVLSNVVRVAGVCVCVLMCVLEQG